MDLCLHSLIDLHPMALTKLSTEAQGPVFVNGITSHCASVASYG
jgi:hypothetical protein